MAQSVTYQKSLAVSGRTFTKQASVPGDAGLLVEPDGGIAAAKAGTITGFTDTDTAIATLSSGHGIVTSDIVDAYFSGGARFGMTATVSGNNVTIDGGSGTSLPNTGTALTIKKPQEESFHVNGANLKGLYLKSAAIGRIAFYNQSGTPTYATTLTAGESKAWVDGDGVTNPLASETLVHKVTFSHGSTAVVAQLAAAVYT
jgi:hypothetical protein